MNFIFSGIHQENSLEVKCGRRNIKKFMLQVSDLRKGRVLQKGQLAKVFNQNP